MARLLTSGFELNSTTGNVEFSSLSGSPTIITSPVRSGTYSGGITGLTSGSPKRFSFSLDVVKFHTYHRFYFRYSTLPTGNNTIYKLTDSGSTSVFTVRMALTSSGSLALFDGTGQIGSNSPTLTVDTWYCIEIKADYTSGSGASVVTGLLNGTSFASATNRTFSGNINNAWIGGNLIGETQTTGVWYFDDWGINDETGTFQNTYLGEGSIVSLRPNGAGDLNQWQKDSGASGSSTNYTLVNEVTPNDATNYIRSNVQGNRDFYNIEDAPFTSSATINLVEVCYRSGVTAFTSGERVSPLIKKASGGTISSGTPNAPSNSGSAWYTNGFSSSALNYPKLSLNTDPDGSQWTKSTIDTAQIGIEASTVISNYMHCTNLWLNVEYVDSSTPAPNPSNGKFFAFF